MSAQGVNRFGEEITALPIRRVHEDPTDVAIGSCFVAIGRVVRVHRLELGDGLHSLTEAEQDRVDEALAGLLLIPQMCSPDPVRPATPDGEYPKWGRIYYAEPPLGGQTKRWLVVSHNVFNAYSGLAVCVRTTSNTSLQGPTLPSIQRGFALAVAPDVMAKKLARFDLLSNATLSQVEFAEMRKVAISLANHLDLTKQAGLLP